MKNRFRLLAVVLAFGGFAAACSSEPATRADFVDELMTGDEGFTEAQANCAADAAEEAGLDFEIVNQTVEEASSEDVETLTGILVDCVLGS